MTDIAVWRPAGGQWWIKGSRAGEYVVAFGMRGDLPVPNDFDADGRTDLAVWREATGDWWILGSTEGVRSAHHGMRGDIPLLGDYDGDGRGDLAVARPGASGLRWLIELSRGGNVDTVFGLATDRPVNGVRPVAPATWKPPGR